MAFLPTRFAALDFVWTLNTFKEYCLMWGYLFIMNLSAQKVHRSGYFTTWIMSSCVLIEDMNLENGNHFLNYTDSLFKVKLWAVCRTDVFCTIKQMIARWGFLISKRHLPHNYPKLGPNMMKSRPTNSPKNVIEPCSSMLLKNEFTKFSQCASASVMFPNRLHWRQSILNSQNFCVFKCVCWCV